METHLFLHNQAGESPLFLPLVQQRGAKMDKQYMQGKMDIPKTVEKRTEINRALHGVIATMYLLYKVNILTNRHIKTMLKAIDTDKDPIQILKELKDIAGSVND